MSAPRLALPLVALIPALLAAWFAARPVAAGESEASADVVAGRAILEENGCNGACHQARVKGADPLTLYTRSIRKVNSREELKRQVEMCVSALNAPIFPEDIDHVVSALDHDAYHFD